MVLLCILLFCFRICSASLTLFAKKIRGDNPYNKLNKESLSVSPTPRAKETTLLRKQGKVSRSVNTESRKSLSVSQHREQEKSLGQPTPRAGKVSRSTNTESRKSLSVSQHREQEKSLATPRAGKVSRNTESRKSLLVSQHREQEKSLGQQTPRAGKVSRSVQHREQEKPLGQSNTESRKSLSVSPTPRAGKASRSVQHREQKNKKSLGLSNTESKKNLTVSPTKDTTAGLQVFGRTRTSKIESARVLSSDDPKWLWKGHQDKKTSRLEVSRR
jgi:hypothetical protein